MTRLWTVESSGIASLKLAEEKAPRAPGPGEVAIEVHAVSLNYRDLMVAEGRYGKPLARPMVPCSDAAGIVTEVGAGVRGFEPGDRVLTHPFHAWPAGPLRREHMAGFVGGGGIDGVLRERLVYPAGALVRVPAHLDFAEASTMTIAGLTAWAGLVTFGRTRPGEWVLVHGTGGVSIYGLQLAKAMGARAIVTTSSAAKGNLCRERFGADAIVDWRVPEWPAKVMHATGDNGADVILDTAGGNTLARSLEAAAYGARVAVIGILEANDASVSVVRILARQLHIGGIYMESRAELEAFANAMEARAIHPVIDRVFPFEKAPEAYAHLQSGAHLGKVVIAVRG